MAEETKPTASTTEENELRPIISTETTMKDSTINNSGTLYQSVSHISDYTNSRNKNIKFENNIFHSCNVSLNVGNTTGKEFPPTRNKADSKKKKIQSLTVRRNYKEKKKVDRRRRTGYTNQIAERKIRENNENFYLIFASQESRKCASCGNEILFRAQIPGEMLVLRHEERFIYPIGKGKKLWSKTAVTRTRMRQVYVHLRKACILRYRDEYFQRMPLIINDTDVRAELLRYKPDFGHPDLTKLYNSSQ